MCRSQESHPKELEKLDSDLLCKTEKKATDDVENNPKNTVLSMNDLTSPMMRTHIQKIHKCPTVAGGCYETGGGGGGCDMDLLVLLHGFNLSSLICE